MERFYEEDSMKFFLIDTENWLIKLVSFQEKCLLIFAQGSIP